jgi:uncharacterized membrane protein
MLAIFESTLNRLPLIQSIYGGVKKLISTLEVKPEGVQRVVLIDFPSPEMKAVGLVTRIIAAKNTGRRLAVVYVPTTPNPTSGYLEIVPIERVVPTDWTLDEAMNFVISAGAVAPSRPVDFTDELDRPISLAEIDKTTGAEEKVHHKDNRK